MKKFKLFTLSIMLTVICLMAFDSGSDKYTGGAPAGYTGSPGDGKNCKQCHGGTTVPQDGIITSNIPFTGYSPGVQYNITVTLDGTGKKGFEVSPQDASGNLLGTLEAGTGSKLVGGGKYITHTSGSNQNPKEWTFLWTAPVQGTGEVTFYGAFTISKPTTKLSTLSVQEDPGIGYTDLRMEAINIYPNPVRDHFIVKLNKPIKSIKIIDITGKTIENIVGNPENEYRLNQKYKSGIYFMQIRTDQGIYIEKMVVSS